MCPQSSWTSRATRSCGPSAGARRSGSSAVPGLIIVGACTTETVATATSGAPGTTLLREPRWAQLPLRSERLGAASLPDHPPPGPLPSGRGSRAEVFCLPDEGVGVVPHNYEFGVPPYLLLRRGILPLGGTERNGGRVPGGFTSLRDVFGLAAVFRLRSSPIGGTESILPSSVFCSVPSSERSLRGRDDGAARGARRRTCRCGHR
jgi:hypothetical protein